MDTERSTDHDWGPRLCVFLGDEDADRLAGPAGEMLAGRLPASFRGYPVAFGVTRDPGSGRARAALSWYPRDVWRYVLSCQWSRIAEEEAFPGRCAEAGDRAYLIAAEAHNQLGLTEPLDTGTRLYYTRPYQVLGAERFATALSGAITDPLVRPLPPIGAADQVIDSTPALGDLRYPRAVITAR